MANRIKIDTRLLNVAWTTGTTYRLALGAGLVREEEGNRSPSSAQDSAKVFTTFDSGPTISSVTPPLGTTSSSITSATITFNRTIFDIPSSNNIFLYKEVIGGTDELVATLPTSSSRVSRVDDTILINLNNLVDGNGTYYLQSNDVIYKDMFNFNNENISKVKFKYSTAFGPVPVSVTPLSGTTGTFVSTATITFNKNISLSENNFYLYNEEGVYRTFAANSSSLRVINSNTVEITLYNQPIPEDEYYIGYDKRTIFDNVPFSADEVKTDGLLKWTSKSITDIANDEYNSRTTTPIFENNWFNVLDRSLNPDEQYTLTLIATSGTFTATGGISVGNTWIYTGTNQQISNIGGVGFVANVKDMNWDLPVQTTLAKQDTILAVRNNTIIGLPYDLDSMPLVSNSYTNIISSATVLTVNANTVTQLTGNDSGSVVYKAGTSTIGVSTFINNQAVLTVPAGQLPVGTYSIYAEWAGRVIPPKFNGRDSNTISQTILPKSPITFSVNPIADFFYHNLDGSTYASQSTATIKLINIYPNAKPGGTISLFDGDNFLGSDVLELEGSTSTAIITWNPNSESQVDQGNRNLRIEYAGDDWNLDAISTATFQARTRRQAILSLSASTSSYVRPTNITLNVNTTATFENKLLAFVATTGTASSGVFSSTQKTFTFDSRILTPGSNSIYAQFLQDFSYVSTNSNLTTFTVAKGTPDTASLTYSNTNTFTQPVLLDLNLGSTPAKGTSTYILEDVSPYTIRPVAVEYEPYFPNPQHLTLKFDPIDRDRITELNFRFGNPGEDKLDLLFNNQPINFVPGSTVTTYAYIYNPYYANSMNSSFPDDYYLEIWRGTNQLGDSADPNTSPLFNTATWLSLSTGTLSLRIQGTTATQYPTTSTTLETKTLIDQISTSSYLTIPVGNWKISNNVGSDPDSNYNSPISRLIHINRKELLPNFVNIVGAYYNDSDPSGGTNSVRLTFDVTPNSSLNNINNKLWDIPNEFLPNRNILVKFYYRWLPTSTTPLPASTSTSWQQGDLWNEYSFSANTPSTPLGSIPRLVNTNADGDTFALLLSESTSPSVYPYPIFGRPEITVSSQTYFIDGFFFEINYSGSNATATTAAVPGRVVRGYIYYTGSQEVQTNAIITYNSTS